LLITVILFLLVALSINGVNAVEQNDTVNQMTQTQQNVTSNISNTSGTSTKAESTSTFTDAKVNYTYQVNIPYIVNVKVAVKEAYKVKVKVKQWYKSYGKWKYKYVYKYVTKYRTVYKWQNQTRYTTETRTGYYYLSNYISEANSTNSPQFSIIINGTGGDVTKNSLIKNNIPQSTITNQVSALAKIGTPMVKFGNGNGPTVMIVAGVHGNELPATIAAMKLINYLNGKDINGTIYVVPFLIPANTAKSYRLWKGQNPNSVAQYSGTPTNSIIKLAQQLGVDALGDFHSTQPGGVPGKNSAMYTKIPNYESYLIASYISKQTGSALIGDTVAGQKYPGAVEDVCNLAGIPAVTCEVKSSHGYVASGSVDKSYSQMLAFLKYEKII
jgi:predicted deacylase